MAEHKPAPKTDPVRRLADPHVSADGNLIGKSSLTPVAMKTRGAIAIPPNKVIPVIMVPGIMGSNLRAKRTPANEAQRNKALNPGRPAWSPPNGKTAGLNEAATWEKRNPRQRQRILDGDTVEVDDSGTIDTDDEGSADDFDVAPRARWWGELHWDSYGELLVDLQGNLNRTFKSSILGNRILRSHWEKVVECDKGDWNASDMAALTEPELEKFATFQYPVYACGYNWIQSNERSAERLRIRIEEIVKFWTDRNFDCKQVILVTHSMGGLVARACAKQIPNLIAGIVHGVMPALGAPLAYRRITCGTETTSPGKGWVDGIAMGKFADIAGRTPDRTTPAMATACGALELLPNHLYPKPWLTAAVKKPDGTIIDIAQLQPNNPYDLYRDLKIWYRLINPDLADPSGKFREIAGGVAVAIERAVRQAEHFHTELLHTYYHPTTYAYYGADEDQMSFGVFRWVTENQAALAKEIGPLLPLGQTAGGTWSTGARAIGFPTYTVAKEQRLFFAPGEQDAPGDGTVPQQSGDGPRGKIKRIFRTTGYDHQGSYKDDAMLKLTHHLIVKIAQGAR